MKILPSRARRVKSTKSRKVEVELLARPTYRCSHLAKGLFGLVSINRTVYAIVPLGETSADGFRLSNTRNGQVYDLDTSGDRPTCDCADFTYRTSNTAEGCKHLQALNELRREGSI